VLVPIVPREPDGVLAHRLGRNRLRRRLEHGQGAGFRALGLVGLAVFLDPLVVAKGARTRVAQVLERERAPVPVLPLDVHARPLGEVDFDLLRVGIGDRTHEFSIAHRSVTILTLPTAEAYVCRFPMPKREDKDRELHEVMRSERSRGARQTSVAGQRHRDVLRRMETLLALDDEREFLATLKEEFGISETSPQFASVLQAWRARR